VIVVVADCTENLVFVGHLAGIPVHMEDIVAEHAGGLGHIEMAVHIQVVVSIVVVDCRVDNLVPVLEEHCSAEGVVVAAVGIPDGVVVAELNVANVVAVDFLPKACLDKLEAVSDLPTELLDVGLDLDVDLDLDAALEVALILFVDVGTPVMSVAEEVLVVEPAAAVEPAVAEEVVVAEPAAATAELAVAEEIVSGEPAVAAVVPCVEVVPSAEVPVAAAVVEPAAAVEVVPVAGVSRLLQNAVDLGTEEIQKYHDDVVLVEVAVESLSCLVLALLVVPAPHFESLYPKADHKCSRWFQSYNNKACHPES